MDTSQYGTRTFNTWQNKCREPYAPLELLEPTFIDITHPEHDINLLNKSWLNVEFEMSISLDKSIFHQKDKEIPYYFVGWKNAAECIRRIEVYNDNKFTGYLQPDNDRETWLQFTKYCTREDKRENYFSHTLYKDAYNHNNNVCGTYIPIHMDDELDDVGDQDLSGGDVVGELNNQAGYNANTPIKEIKFSIVVPLNEIPALRYFKEYPSCFGPLTLKVEFSKDAMVWCPCKYRDIKTNNISVSEQDKVQHQFAQVGDKLYTQWIYNTAEKTIEDIAALSTDVTLNVLSLEVKNFTADIQGYKITTDGKISIDQQFPANTPMVYPCLYTYCRTFDGLMSARRYNIEFPMAVHNVKDINLTFPMKSRNKTCFYNPMLKDVQMRINNVNVPEKPVRTDDARFMKYNINGYHADLDYTNSLKHLPIMQTVAHVKQQKGYIYAWTPTDCSDFIVTFPMERDNEPNAFDGLETGDENINFHLDGSCIGTVRQQAYGMKQTDTATDANGVIQNIAEEIPPSPNVMFTSKAYWTADVENGLVFHPRGVPNF